MGQHSTSPPSSLLKLPSAQPRWPRDEEMTSSSKMKLPVLISCDERTNVDTYVHGFIDVNGI
jgi:hypothetical protein